ncbi:glycosyltransferase, partial [Amylibacter sp.]|nr:glycosyltransferase [Amylibacter sp.]
MSGYDFLVLPTTWHGEGYPGVIIEAFSIGLPVIATNFRAIPDLVKDNYNGFLVEQNNIDNLILIITALRDERAFYATMCSQSKITFKSSYDSDVLHKVFFETIEKLG